MSDLYRVAEFARLAGVTVRTLQYYDRIDLLKPAQSTRVGIGCINVATCCGSSKS